MGSAVEEVSDWKALGHQLDVNPVKLCELQQSDRNPEDCKEELLIFWVEHDRSASWKKLVRALDRMEEQDIAQRIREKYIYTQGNVVGYAPSSKLLLHIMFDHFGKVCKDSDYTISC